MIDIHIHHNVALFSHLTGACLYIATHTLSFPILVDTYILLTLYIH